MSIFDSLFKPNVSSTVNANAQAAKDINSGKDQAIGFEKKGLKYGATPLNEAANTLLGFGTQFQPGVDTYLGSLGLNGQPGYDLAMGAYHASPELDLANQNYLRHAAAIGGLNSGGSIAGLQQLGAQDFNNWQDRLAALINPLYQGKAGYANSKAKLSDLISGNFSNRANIATGAASNKASIGMNTGAAQTSADAAGTENFWNAILAGLKAAGQVAGAA